jgi:hypothetical protein
VPGSAPDHRYLLDNAQAEAGERFVALAELFDGVTRGHFDRLGVGPGWRCWEVGAGGRSIPEALAAAVGPTGYVLATDIKRGIPAGCRVMKGTWVYSCQSRLLSWSCSEHVVKDDAGDSGDRRRGDYFERGWGSEQRFHRLLVLERLGKLGGIFPVRVGCSRGQPSGQDLGRCAEQHDVVEAGVEEDLEAAAPRRVHQGRPAIVTTAGAAGAFAASPVKLAV